MGTLQIAAVLTALAAPGETVLLDFTAAWCGPCRAMTPTIDRLVGEGHPVRKIDIDADKAAAQRYRITKVPCFVMLVDGREVDRVVGQASYERLRRMLARGRPARPKNTLEQTRFQSPASRQNVNTSASRYRASSRRTNEPQNTLRSRLLQASVRIRIEQPDSSNIGSGTIIDARGDEALVLTCGHLFENAGDGKKNTAKITVEVFDGGRIDASSGRLVHVDSKSDLALVSFRTKGPVRVIPVAPVAYKVSRGDAVINIGGDHGARPTIRTGRVLAINSFVGPANFKVSGQPVQGRSGGGLFTHDGYTIGVCNFADPTDKAGGYAALRAIHAALNEVGLSDVYREKQRPTANGGLRTNVSVSSSARASADVGRAQGAGPSSVEVICIVRDHRGTAGGNRVIVLERASKEFLQILASERAAQQRRNQTSLAARRSQWQAIRDVPQRAPSPAEWAPRRKPAR